MAFGYAVVALLMFILIITIPFGIASGLANFKLIPVSLMPLGREIVDLPAERLTPPR